MEKQAVPERVMTSHMESIGEEEVYTGADK